MGYTFTRQRLYPGFDGKICKTSPRIGSDGKDTFLIYHLLYLGGSDVCVGHEIIKTTDGKDFTEPKKLLGLEDEYKEDVRIKPDSDIIYSKKYEKWFGIGRTTYYACVKHPVLLGEDKPTVRDKIML